MWQRIWCFAAETVKNFYKIIPLIQMRALRPAGRLSMKTGERHLRLTAWGMGWQSPFLGILKWLVLTDNSAQSPLVGDYDDFTHHPLQ